MKNTIYLNSDFNFLLLENEEEDSNLNQTKIYINIPTSDATNQELEISVAGGAPITESIPSETLVNFELSQEYWADNGDVEITPKNDDITGDTITIHFPGIFTTSAALNYIADDEFEIVAQNENFAEGGSGSGSGSSGGSAFDFVETIRNIGFRLLDEPSNVNAYFDEVAEEVQIKWTDPADIASNEPAPATWAGTVVVRKEGSAPRHRWDGVEIVDSTTRDQYSSNALVDNTLDISKNYYYGIFPYDKKGDYRFTKICFISTIVNLQLSIVDIVTNGNIGIIQISVPEVNQGISLKYKKSSSDVINTINVTSDMLYIYNQVNYYCVIIDDLSINESYDFWVENGSFETDIINVTPTSKQNLFNYSSQKTKVAYVKNGSSSSSDLEQSISITTNESDCYTMTYQDTDIPQNQYILLLPNSYSYHKLVFLCEAERTVGTNQNNRVRNMLFMGRIGSNQYSFDADVKKKFLSNSKVYVPVILSLENYTANDIFTMRYGVQVDNIENTTIKFKNISIWFE